MEKKKLMYVTLSIVLLLSICFAIPSVGNSKVFDVTSQEFTTAKPTTISSLEAANSIIKTETIDIAECDIFAHVATVKEIKTLFSNKENKLNQLTLLENKKGASYKRIRSEIESGKATERITLSEVKEIISQNTDYSTIKPLLIEAHGGADVVFGSGIEVVEIWLTDDASEKITMTLGRIYYASVYESIRLF